MAVLYIGFFAGVIALIVWITRIQIGAFHEDIAERKQAMTQVLQLDPRYQAKIEADRRFHLATRKLDIEQFQAMTQLAVSQHGMLVSREIAESWVQVSPIHKPQLKLSETTQSIANGAITTPGAYDMREIWHSFRPSTSQIFLGKSEHGNIIVPGNKLLHCIATGPTGGGKTATIRMILCQLVYIGCEVTLMDIHYAPIKTDEGGNDIDWRPIIDRLATPPIYQMDAIIAWMKWLAYTELENRIAKQRNGQKIGKPIFFTIAELPAVLDEAGKDVAQPLAKILRQGRQYQIFFIGDSQDLLTDTLHMTTGPRECFRTGYYTGGDPTTAKALLDLPKGVTISEEGIGQEGLMYLKTAIHPYQLARVGWASNESLYDLFETPVSQRLSAVRSVYDLPVVTPVKNPLRPPVEQHEDDNYARKNARVVDADTGDLEPLRPSVTPVKNPLRPPVEQTQQENYGRNEKYLLSNDEITRFIAAYRARPNIDEALAAIGKGTHYRPAARRVIEAYGLKKEED